MSAIKKNADIDILKLMAYVFSKWILLALAGVLGAIVLGGIGYYSNPQTELLVDDLYAKLSDEERYKVEEYSDRKSVV